MSVVTTQSPAVNIPTTPLKVGNGNGHNGHRSPLRPDFNDAPPLAEISEPKGPLPQEELSHISEPRTGQQLDQSLPKTGDHQHILVAVDPECKPELTERAIAIAKHLAKPGDLVVLLSVLPTQYPAYGLVVPTPYDWNWEVEQLRNVRAKRAQELNELSGGFPANVNTLIHVVHGGVEKKILHAIEQHSADLIILGKRKVKLWERLTTASVSNYIVAHSPCNVLVVKADIPRTSPVVG